MAAIKPERIQKVLAQQGLAARRQVESWIQDGRLSCNGNTVAAGHRYTPNATYALDGKPLSLQATPNQTETSAHQTIIYYKPEGQICSRHDPQGRPTVFDALPKPPQGLRWVMIGRLDINTSGLLLFTTDGDLAHRMMHPSFEEKREYLVRVYGEPTQQQLQKLKQGVELDDGPAAFDSLKPLGQAGHRNRWYQVSLCEGRNRIVRRLWASQGLTVSRLKRIRFGAYSLPKALKLGEWTLS